MLGELGFVVLVNRPRISWDRAWIPCEHYGIKIFKPIFSFWNSRVCVFLAVSQPFSPIVASSANHVCFVPPAAYLQEGFHHCAHHHGLPINEKSENKNLPNLQEHISRPALRSGWGEMVMGVRCMLRRMLCLINDQAELVYVIKNSTGKIHSHYCLIAVIVTLFGVHVK